MNEDQRAAPPPRRRRPLRAGPIAALAVVGGFSCWLISQGEWRVVGPTPERGNVTFDVIVSDADTNGPVPGAEVEIDMETGEFDPPGPVWKGTTDATGLLRLVHSFKANTVPGKDGKARGRVVFAADPMFGFSYLLVVRAPGYREESIRLTEKYPRGVDHEDPAPRPLRVPLSPRPL